ncbi:MAG: hypothetical protein H0X16_09560 [Chloroflexi bacterium]|nr:hypothetical protein [Chloroflexota bacterium]
MLVVRAVDKDGKPIEGLSCDPKPDIPGAWGSGDIGYGTAIDGRCRFENVPAMGYWVELSAQAGEDWRVVGRKRVVVPPNGVGRVTIVVATPAGG